MKKLIIFLLLTIPVITLMGQSGVWDEWDAAVVQKANTAKNIPSMNEEEKKVILCMNLARFDGDLFASTFLTQYINENGVEKTRYVKSLYRDLKEIEGLPLLQPEEDLTSIAQGHATKSGNTGHVGHKDFDKRFKPVIGNPYQQIGENCSYGFNQAIDIVITLLIDEGVSDVGHRKNTLNENFNSVGVAIRPHKKYRSNCVIDFGRKTRSDLNEVPY